MAFVNTGDRLTNTLLNDLLVQYGNTLPATGRIGQTRVRLEGYDFYRWINGAWTLVQIGTTGVEDASITSSNLAPGVAAAGLSDDVITTAKLSDNSIGLSELAHGTAERYIGFNSLGTPSSVQPPSVVRTFTTPVGSDITYTWDNTWATSAICMLMGGSGGGGGGGGGGGASVQSSSATQITVDVTNFSLGAAAPTNGVAGEDGDFANPIGNLRIGGGGGGGSSGGTGGSSTVTVGGNTYTCLGGAGGIGGDGGNNARYTNWVNVPSYARQGGDGGIVQDGNGSHVVVGTSNTVSGGSGGNGSSTTPSFAIAAEDGEDGGPGFLSGVLFFVVTGLSSSSTFTINLGSGGAGGNGGLGGQRGYGLGSSLNGSNGSNGTASTVNGSLTLFPIYS